MGGLSGPKPRRPLVESIELVLDGGGLALTTGSKAFLEVAFGATITAVRLMADQVGSVQLDLKKADYAAMPTTSSIVGASPPTLSSAQKSEDATLLGWTTALAAGDWLEVTVTSASLVQRLTVSLTVRRA